MISPWRKRNRPKLGASVPYGRWKSSTALADVDAYLRAQTINSPEGSDDVSNQNRHTPLLGESLNMGA
jgi:hypothetical protein